MFFWSGRGICDLHHPETDAFAFVQYVHAYKYPCIIICEQGHSSRVRYILNSKTPKILISAACIMYEALTPHLDCNNNMIMFLTYSDSAQTNKPTCYMLYTQILLVQPAI